MLVGTLDILAPGAERCQASNAVRATRTQCSSFRLVRLRLVCRCAAGAPGALHLAGLIALGDPPRADSSSLVASSVADIAIAAAAAFAFALDAVKVPVFRRLQII